jgi:hypothetical protein
MLFLRHPAWLWLKKHDKSKLPPVDDNLQAMFDAGNEFEKIAEQLFPNGYRLGFNNYDEYLSLPERTRQALADGQQIIFQGRFEFGDLTFICDVIEVINDRVVDLYEIKSSTKVRLEHELDLAFQAYVLQKLGFEVRQIKVVIVNTDYIKNGEVRSKEITKVEDVTTSVKSRLGQTEKDVQKMLKVANQSEIPNISPSLVGLGALKEWLKIYRGLVDVTPESIYDLTLLGPDKIGALEELGVKNIIAIPEDFKLSEKQLLQVRATKSNKILVKSKEIKDFLNSLIFPLYFLDYETLSSVVPHFDGLHPYQQLPFQYSLHILETPDSELRHAEYLHTDSSNPVKNLVKSLQENIGDQGSIIVWYEGFEKLRNSEMALLLPDFRVFLENLNARVVDLMLPFSNGHFVHKDFKGSASIKNILPVLVPKLSYKLLGINEGGMAQRVWMDTFLKNKNSDNKEQIVKDLIEYCKLDTLAMVEIYQYLINNFQ